MSTDDYLLCTNYFRWLSIDRKEQVYDVIEQKGHPVTSVESISLTVKTHNGIIEPNRANQFS